MTGILNLDKPAGWTSHDAVAKLRRILKKLTILQQRKNKLRRQIPKTRPKDRYLMNRLLKNRKL